MVALINAAFQSTVSNQRLITGLRNPKWASLLWYSRVKQRLIRIDMHVYICATAYIDICLLVCRYVYIKFIMYIVKHIRMYNDL